MIYFYYFILFNLVIYFAMILLFIIGLFIKSNTSNENTNISGVSVIICVKNGESSIYNLINDLKKQIFENNYEFIIVDDMSTDNTKNIILENISGFRNFKYITSDLGNKNLLHKKKALDAGIKVSQYEYLLFTDVGCRLPNRWIDSMMKNYQNNVDFIIGCSIIRNPKTLASYFQMIDFSMLMISTYSTSKLGLPLASTGQNQSYKKKLYTSIGGFSKIKKILQGDDSIFLNLLNNNQKINSIFSINQNSYVKSKLHYKWKNLLLQRIRWAGDANIMWKYNKLFYLIIISTFFANLFYIFLPFLFFEDFNFVLLTFLIKFIFEFVLYICGITKINQEINFLYFLYWFIIQIPYVVLVGLLSFLSPLIGWKEQ